MATKVAADNKPENANAISRQGKMQGNRNPGQTFPGKEGGGGAASSDERNCFLRRCRKCFCGLKMANSSKNAKKP